MCTLWDFQVFLLLVRRGSERFGVSAQTDSGIRISAFLIYPTRSYCAYFWCALLWDFQVFLLLVRRWSELYGVFSIRLTVVLGFLHSLYTLLEVIVPISEPLWDFQVFLLLVRRVSELFGVAAQTESVIRIFVFLSPTISYCGYFWCAFSETFRYFYC